MAKTVTSGTTDNKGQLTVTLNYGSNYTFQLNHGGADYAPLDVNEMRVNTDNKNIAAEGGTFTISPTAHYYTYTKSMTLSNQTITATTSITMNLTASTDDTSYTIDITYDQPTQTEWITRDGNTFTIAKNEDKVQKNRTATIKYTNAGGIYKTFVVSQDYNGKTPIGVYYAATDAQANGGNNIAYNATTTTLTFKGWTITKYLDGTESSSSTNCSLTSTAFSTNTGSTEVTRTFYCSFNGGEAGQETSGYYQKITQNQYGKTQPTGEYAYRIDTITVNNQASSYDTYVEYNVGTLQVDFTTGKYNLLYDGTVDYRGAVETFESSSSFTQSNNSGTTAIPVSGTVMYNNMGSVQKEWKCMQYGAKQPTGGYSYAITSVYPTASDKKYIAYNLTQFTVQYTGVTYSILHDGTTSTSSEDHLSTDVSVGNTGSTLATWNGNVTAYHGQSARYEFYQYGAKQPNGEYVYDVEARSISVGTNPMAWDASANTVSYTVCRTPKSYDGSVITESREIYTSVSNQAVSHNDGPNTGTSERTVGGQFFYPATGTALTGGGWTAKQKPGAFTVTFTTNAPGGTISIS